MTVNWLFYACVKKKALLFTYIKRFCDIISSIAIMLVTIPLSIIAMVIIKFSDLDLYSLHKQESANLVNLLR